MNRRFSDATFHIFPFSSGEFLKILDQKKHDEIITVLYEKSQNEYFYCYQWTSEDGFLANKLRVANTSYELLFIARVAIVMLIG